MRFPQIRKVKGLHELFNGVAITQNIRNKETSEMVDALKTALTVNDKPVVPKRALRILLVSQPSNATHNSLNVSPFQKNSIDWTRNG